MAAHTHLRPDIVTDRSPAHADERPPVLWPVVLLIAMALAAVGGLALAARMTGPSAPTSVYVSPAPDAHDRVPASTIPPPNANERESRIPTPTLPPPNANERESRIPNSVTGACGAHPYRPGPGSPAAILGARHLCVF